MNYIDKNLEIILNIEDMPVKDQKSINLFAESLLINLKNQNIYISYNTNHSKDFLIIKANINNIIYIQEIKGPKQNTKGEEFFKNKYIGSEFFYKNDYLYVNFKLSNIENIIFQTVKKTIYEHPWSINMKWNNYKISCCRPILKISILIDNKLINLIDENLKNDYLSLINNHINIKNIPIFLEKYDKLNKELTEIKYSFNKDYLLNHLIYMINNPKIIYVEFDEKYLCIPDKIIENFLIKEQLSILLFDKTKMINKCICLVEDHININIDNFKLSIEAKLFDLLLQYNRDISKPIDIYIKERNEKIINDKLGTVKDKIIRMINIAKNINFNSEIIKNINYFNLDITSEIVQETPELKNIITKTLINNFDLYENELNLLDYIDNLIELSNLNLLPTSNNDPFGLKKQCNYIINYFLDNEISYPLEKAQDYFNNRLKIYLDNLNPFLKYLKVDNAMKYKNFFINIHNLNRINNMLNKIDCNLNINLNQYELNIINDIDNLSIENINPLLDNIIYYIDNNKIAPYIEKKEILLKFIEKLQSFISFDILNEINI